MGRKGRWGSIVLVGCLLVLVGCNKNPVSVDGVLVTNPSTQEAVNAVHNTEIVTVAIGEWVIGARRIACDGVALDRLPLPQPCHGATEALTVYAATITPTVLTAIQGARDGILDVERTKTPTARTKLDLALVALGQAKKTAQDWARAQGYRVK